MWWGGEQAVIKFEKLPALVPSFTPSAIPASQVVLPNVMERDDA